MYIDSPSCQPCTHNQLRRKDIAQLDQCTGCTSSLTCISAAAAACRRSSRRLSFAAAVPCRMSKAFCPAGRRRSAIACTNVGFEGSGRRSVPSISVVTFKQTLRCCLELGPLQQNIAEYHVLTLETGASETHQGARVGGRLEGGLLPLLARVLAGQQVCPRVVRPRQHLQPCAGSVNFKGCTLPCNGACRQACQRSNQLSRASQHLHQDQSLAAVCMGAMHRTSSIRPAKSVRLIVSGASVATSSSTPSGGAFSFLGAALQQPHQATGSQSLPCIQDRWLCKTRRAQPQQMAG